MKILIVEPGKHPYEAEIDSSLESLQKTVGGYIDLSLRGYDGSDF